MADPKLPVTCPTCGEPLEYVTTLKDAPAEDVHVYRCSWHGRFWIRESEGVKPAADVG
jgi:hypothetical protein